MTYLLLNLAFLAVAGVIITLLLRRYNVRLSWQPIVLTLVILLVFTVVFDSLIIALGIVAYDETKLLGILLWHAPVEDMFYSLLACLLMPALWKIGDALHADKS